MSLKSAEKIGLQEASQRGGGCDMGSVFSYKDRLFPDTPPIQLLKANHFWFYFDQESFGFGKLYIEAKLDRKQDRTAEGDVIILLDKREGEFGEPWKNLLCKT